MSRKLSALITFILILCGLYFGTAYVAGRALKKFINKNLSEYLRNHIAVQDVRINPAFAVIDLSGITIGQTRHGKTDLSIASIRIDFEWIPIFFRKIIIEKLEIRKPQFIVIKDTDNKLSMVPAIPLIPFSFGKHRSRHRKYPPATIENISITDAQVTYIDGIHTIEFEPVHAEISTFWRSPDRTRIKLDFSIGSFLKKNKGSFEIAGEYAFENKQHSFAGELYVSNLDLAYIYPVIKDTIPVKIESGYITVNAKPLCSENRLNTILHISITSLKIAPLEKKQQLGGIPVSMIQKFLESTGGTLRADLHIMGTLDKPDFNLNELLTQIIYQKMQKDLKTKINKKASRAADKISEILKKSRQKNKQ